MYKYFVTYEFTHVYNTWPPLLKKIKLITRNKYTRTENAYLIYENINNVYSRSIYRVYVKYVNFLVFYI